MRFLIKWIDVAATRAIALAAVNASAIALATGGIGAIAAVAQEGSPILQVEGVLEEGDAISPNNSSFYDAYFFEGKAGQTLSILMESEEFDTYIFLGNHQREALVAQNDNKDGTTTNAGIVITLSEDGIYSVVAGASDAANRGRYRLTIREVAASTEGGETAARFAEGRRLNQEALKIIYESYETGEFQSAIARLEQALEIFRSIDIREALPQDTKQAEGAVLNSLGAAYAKLGEHRQSLDTFQQALAIHQELGNQSAQGIALNGIGMAYQELSQYQPALTALQNALAIHRRVGDRANEGFALNSIGLAHDSLDQYQQALDAFQQALAITQKLGVRADEGMTLNNIGNTYRNLGQYELALEAFRQALAIRQEIGNRVDAGLTLVNIGEVYDNLGQYEPALEAFQQALAITQEGSVREAFPQRSRAEEGSTFNTIGSVYISLGQYEPALDAFRQALIVMRPLGDRQGVGRILSSIGLTYNYLGRYQPALEAYEQALKIAQDTGDRAGESATLNNIGIIYDNLGQYDLALETYQQALSILQELNDHQREERILKGRTLNNISEIYRNLGRYNLALETYQQALFTTQEVGDRVGEGFTLNNIGLIYDRQGQYNLALETYQQALVIAEEIGNRALTGTTLSNIGLVYDDLGQHDRALEILQQALIISQEIGNLKGEATTLSNIGAAQMLTQQYADAERTLYEALIVLESLRSKDLNDSEKISLFETQRITYESLQQVLVAQSKVTNALEAAERGRARATVELLAEKTSDRPTDAIITDAPNFTEIQRIAQEQDATLVTYSIVDSITGSALYTWVIQPDGTIEFVEQSLDTVEQAEQPLGAALPISTNPIAQLDGPLYRGRQPDASAPLVTELRSGLTSDRGVDIEIIDTATPERLKNLHQLLIDPIAHLLPTDPNEKVIFIPQGSLFLVPFAALQDEDGTYLIEKHTIVTVPSIQVLGLTRDMAVGRVAHAPTVASDDVLIVGNPTMPAVWNPDTNGDEPLRPLPGAEAEAQAIAQQLQVQPLIGDAADEATVRQQMPTARIIHLATHGLLQYGDPQASAVRDVPGAIALTPVGDPDSTTDGLLTSAEILGMDLQADLVVLSACDTGRGEITGDGVIGLSRSLMTAGVPSIIVSLWAVDDNATAELMREFYRLWQAPDAPLDKAQALRQAILATMETHPDPRLWAAFTLIGESR